jgi:hypothetical protein
MVFDKINFKINIFSLFFSQKDRENFSTQKDCFEFFNFKFYGKIISKNRKSCFFLQTLIFPFARFLIF